MKLYHYTTVKHFKGIWESQALLFCSSRKTNDIFERQKLITVSGNPLSNKYNDLTLFCDVLNSYKQISFSLDYNNKLRGYCSPMMWAHYANNTRGVCVEFDSETLFQKNQDIMTDMFYSPVRYPNNLSFIKLSGINLRDRKAIEQFIERKNNDIFFKKHNHWKPENEFRIISSKCGQLSIVDSITTIYVPNVKSYAYRTLKKIVGNNIPIRLLTQSVIKEKRKLSSYNIL